MFKGVHRVRAGGTVYFYAWRGGPRLCGDPETNEQAAQEFFALRTAARQTQSTLFAAVVQQFVASPEFKSRSKDWKKESLRRHDALISRFGKADISLFEDRRMRRKVMDLRDAFADRPRTADKVTTELTTILNWAKNRGDIGPHVAEKIPKLYKVDRSEIIWEAGEIEAVCAVMHKEQRDLFLLAAYTGLDMGDLCALPWSAIGLHDIQTKRGKSRVRAIPPILPEARAVIDGLEKLGPIALTNTRGKPWTPEGYSAIFQRAKKKAGVNKRFKDLRGTACTNFLIAGLSYEETGNAMGWTPATVERMARKYVHRERIASATVARLNANRTVKTAVKKSGRVAEGDS